MDLACSDVPSYVMMWNWNPMGQDHETPKACLRASITTRSWLNIWNIVFFNIVGGVVCNVPHVKTIKCIHVAHVTLVMLDELYGLFKQCFPCKVYLLHMFHA